MKNPDRIEILKGVRPFPDQKPTWMKVRKKVRPYTESFPEKTHINESSKKS